MSPSDYAWWYHNLYIFDERLGIDEIIDEQAGKRRLGFSVERALFAMVANRACAVSALLAGLAQIHVRNGSAI